MRISGDVYVLTSNKHKLLGYKAYGPMVPDIDMDAVPRRCLLLAKRRGSKLSTWR